MKYMEELNKFNVWIALHPDVSSSARLLWFVLMQYNNMFGWKRVFSVSISTLASATGLSVSAVKRARSVLQRAGRIRYTPRNRRLATLYEIISLANEGIRTAYVGNTKPSNEEMNPNHVTTLVELKKDRSTVQSDDVQDVVRDDESRNERYSEPYSKSRGERIYRQDKTRQDISKETTIKKGEAAKGKMKEGPKRCYTSPSVAVVRAYCEERGNRIDSEGLVDISELKRTSHVVHMEGPLDRLLRYACVICVVAASYTDWLCRLSAHPR